MKFLLLINGLFPEQGIFWSKLFLAGVCLFISAYFAFLAHQTSVIIRELDLGAMYPK